MLDKPCILSLFLNPFNELNKHEQSFNYSYNLLNILTEPVHEISNNVVCATSKASDQPAHTRRLIRAFASRLAIL